MFRLYGFYTQNSLKALYVLEELGADYEFEFVNLMEGEQRSEAFLKMAQMRKVPLLEHDGEYLFESGAICRYVANVSDSDLYPEDKLQRARVDQWMDYFTCHLGRWLTTLFYETVIKKKANLGDPNMDSVNEAGKFAKQQLKILNIHLDNRRWIANDALSIADLFAFAYVEQHQAIDLSLADYPNVQSWFDGIASRESIANARKRLPT